MSKNDFIVNGAKPANALDTATESDVVQGYEHEMLGLTKRETIAMHLYAGMLSVCDSSGEFTGLHCADKAVEQADALLKELEK